MKADARRRVVDKVAAAVMLQKLARRPALTADSEDRRPVVRHADDGPPVGGCRLSACSAPPT